MQLKVTLRHNAGDADQIVATGEDEADACTAAKAALQELLDAVPYLAAGDKILITVTAD